MTEFRGPWGLSLNHPREDTIAAPATAAGIGAIAIVRISGPAAPGIVEHLLGRAPRPRHAELAEFRDGEGRLIDQGLALYFPAPRSYTGEDVVELHVHGGPVVSDWLLETIYAFGARPAEPGEFTLRAFLNDKLDLTQAEAVADLIGSRSRLGAQAALRSLGGRFAAEVAALQDRLTELRAFVEAWLDFPDEELDFAATEELAARTAAAGAALATLRAQAANGAALVDGLAVAIAGPPNAGKSSLLNQLAGRDTAIVTDVPGTTRDALKEQIVLDGLPVSIVDTAGLRESRDPIETEGVKRARAEAARADHVLWVGDVRDGVDAIAGAAASVLANNPGYTLVANKIDLIEQQAAVHRRGDVEVVEISALTGAGLDLLVERLKRVAGLGGEVGGTFSARRRHLEALDAVAARLEAARAAYGGGLELAAEELREAQRALSRLTGEQTSDDLLGEIFGRFCIGK